MISLGTFVWQLALTALAVGAVPVVLVQREEGLDRADRRGRRTRRGDDSDAALVRH